VAFSDAELDAAVERLTEPDALRDAQDLVGRMAPQLQRVLMEALAAGGWFQASETAVAEAAATEDPEERTRAVRTLLAEETRLSMLVGTAVGYELAHQLLTQNREDTT
jgi:hypothetical protein